MLSKKVLSIMTAVFIFAGVGGSASAKTIKSVSPVNSLVKQAYTVVSDLQQGGPVDLSIANEEKIIQMLKDEGKIPKNASYEEAHKIYLNYMQDAAKANQNLTISKMTRDLKAKQNQKVKKYNFTQSLKNANAKKVNILVLLVDYKDYKHNSITSEETDMYYKNYSVQHYKDMLFGDKGYTGPNGENLISMKQYYAQQSGGSLDIEGSVAGWYTLPQTAAYYGAQVTDPDTGKVLDNDKNPRSAIAGALKAAAKDPNINLADFDKEDLYDMDGDGDLKEPDGIIDYLMVLHAGVGEEAGGGSLGSSAIWSHSWDLGGIYPIPGTSTDVDYWDGQLAAYNYTIEPEDGATGVFAHEFAHNLGVPDEYDTIYSSDAGEPVSYWSIMSGGSWGGTIPGAEPTGFSPYAKQMFQALYGGNWQKQTILNYSTLKNYGSTVSLRQADEKGQVLRINLPDKLHEINTPTSGKYEYWGGKGTTGITYMTTSVDLTGKTEAALKFKTWYDIEEGYDYARVKVKEEGTDEWTAVPGNITVNSNGITGTSEGWVDGIFSLNAFANKKIELKLEYETDPYVFGSGFYVDDIQVIADNNVVLSDDVEGTSSFTLNGFSKSTGTVSAPQYYLVEWRNQHGVDASLAHISILGQNLSYDPGMVIWYADDFYTDNWTGVHPGEGFLGIVDADQKSIIWNFTDRMKTPMLASGKYQMHDAAFSKNKEAAITINTDSELGRSPVDNYRFTEPIFTDSKNFLNAEIPSLGRNIPKLGIRIQITKQASDNSSATLMIKK